MLIHVLPGDSLAGPFEKTGIDGEVVVCRECFVDGDTQAQDLAGLWKNRSAFLSGNYGVSEEDYQKKTVEEFERLERLAAGNEVVLWFEYELFCQVNLWFTIWYLRNTDTTPRILYPLVEDDSELWKGFGHLSVDQLKACFESRTAISPGDVRLAIELWEAFRTRNFKMLRLLADRENDAFPTVKTVVDAACEIESRPRRILQSIVDGGKTEFGEVLREFNEQAAVYGFGDLQVKRIFEDLEGGDA
ncbi:MAG: DUF1835 domain-containing protein [Acidobacteriota bacterium]|nr:DUF1835 domain-containing protein [Acidobacteriota bacterium]